MDGCTLDYDRPMHCTCIRENVFLLKLPCLQHYMHKFVMFVCTTSRSYKVKCQTWCSCFVGRRDGYLMFKALNTNKNGKLSMEEFYYIFDRCDLKWKVKVILYWANRFFLTTLKLMVTGIKRFIPVSLCVWDSDVPCKRDLH